MKKILLLLFLLFGLGMYSQGYNREIRKLKKELRKEIRGQIKNDFSDTTKIFNLRKKIADLKRKSNSRIDTTNVVVYNFKTKKYTKSNVRPRVGEPLVFKIEDINRLAYEVSIASNDVAIMDEYFSEEFKTAIRNISTAGSVINVERKDIQSPKVTEATGKSNGTNEPDKPNTDINKLEDDLIVEKNKIIKSRLEIASLKNNLLLKNQELNELTEKSNQIDNQSNNEESKKLKEDIKKYNDTLLIKLKDTIDSQTKIQLIENNLKRKMSTTDAVSRSFNKINEKYLELYKLYNSLLNYENYYNSYRQLVLSPSLNYKDYISKIDENVLKLKIEEIKTDVINIQKEFNNFYELYNTNYYDSALLNKLTTESKDNLLLRYNIIKEEVDKLKKLFDALDITSKYLKVEAIHRVMKDEKNYFIASSPIQPFEDYVTFEVKIKHRDPNKISEFDDNREFVYMEYTRGGVRFDFSTGVVFNFGGNNNAYEIKDVIQTSGSGDNIVNTPKKEIVLTNKNDFTPMLSGMFHTSYRSSNNFSIGLTLGASLNVETFQLNSLFPGFSLLIGKKQKFIITAGPAFRQVEVLKNRYEAGVLYDVNEISDSSQLTSQQFKVGFFAGLTYNLTNSQKSKIKINGSE